MPSLNEITTKTGLEKVPVELLNRRNKGADSLKMAESETESPLLSPVRLLATPQTTQSMEFSRPEYSSG